MNAIDKRMLAFLRDECPRQQDVIVTLKKQLDALRARLEAAEKLISLLDARDAVEVQPELFASEKKYRHALRQAAERVQAARAQWEAMS